MVAQASSSDRPERLEDGNRGLRELAALLAAAQSPHGARQPPQGGTLAARSPTAPQQQRPLARVGYVLEPIDHRSLEREPVIESPRTTGGVLTIGEAQCPLVLSRRLTVRGQVDGPVRGRVAHANARSRSCGTLGVVGQSGVVLQPAAGARPGCCRGSAGDGGPAPPARTASRVISCRKRSEPGIADEYSGRTRVRRGALGLAPHTASRRRASTWVPMSPPPAPHLARV